MTKKEFLDHLNFKPVPGYEGILETIKGLVGDAYDAGFKEGMETTIELQEKMTNLMFGKKE